MFAKTLGAMQIEQTIQCKLEQTDSVTAIANQDGTVTLCCRSELSAPQGLQIQFTTGHIDSLERLLALLWKEFETRRTPNAQSD